MSHPIASTILTLALAATPSVARASNNPLGLDTPWPCTAGNPTSSADKSEGLASMKFGTSGYSLCTSPTMACSGFSLTSEELLVDVKLPATLPNPWWVGDLSLYVEVPSATVYNSWVGMALLTGLPTNQWTTVRIPATQTMMAALRSGCGDAKLKFALNTSAPGVLVDNIRFGGSSGPQNPPVEMLMSVESDQDDGQFDPSLSSLPYGWSTQGERDNALYVGSYAIDEWGGGNGYTTGAFRFELSQDIPAGARVVDARLSLFGLGDWEWDSAVDALQVAVELSDDAAVIGSLQDMPLSTTGRPLLGKTVRWPETGGLAWQTGAWNQSTNLASLLEELVDTMGGLAAGAHVQFFVYGVTPNLNGEVLVEDSSNAAADPPRLAVVIN